MISVKVAMTFATTHFATVCHAALGKNTRLARTSGVPLTQFNATVSKHNVLGSNVSHSMLQFSTWGSQSFKLQVSNGAHSVLYWDWFLCKLAGRCEYPGNRAWFEECKSLLWKPSANLPVLDLDLPRLCTIVWFTMICLRRGTTKTHQVLCVWFNSDLDLANLCAILCLLHDFLDLDSPSK